MAAGSAQEVRQIAGFWRRLVAAIVDALVLAAPAFFVGNLFFDELAELGQNGRFIGLVVSLAYFGILNSSLGKGQTLGKRLLGVRVVGASGRPIGLLRSVVRSSILSVPFYLNGFDLTPFAADDESTVLLGAFASFFVFGCGSAIIYLYVFNRRTRQSLHDLFVESFVVRAEQGGDVAARVWPAHVAIALGLLVVSLAGPAMLQRHVGELASDDLFKSLQGLEEGVVSKHPNIRRVSATTETVTLATTKETSTTKFLVVEVRLRRRVEDTPPIFRDVAMAVLEREPNILGQDKLKITISTGFELGIVTVTNSQTEVGTVAEWREMTGGGQAIEASADHADTFSSFVKSTLGRFFDIKPGP